MDCHKPFTKDRQERRNVGVALSVGECFDCLELNDGDIRGTVLRVTEKDSKALVGVCYTPPQQNEEADEIFS